MVSFRSVIAESGHGSVSPGPPYPDKGDRRAEATIIEGTLGEVALIMVVDKSAAIAVNSYPRLGSLSA